jgi:membrane-associated phospholipid phosphatase
VVATANVRKDAGMNAHQSILTKDVNSPEPRGSLRGGLFAALCIVLMIACYWLVDRPFAFFVFSKLASWKGVFSVLGDIGDVAVPAAISMAVATCIGIHFHWKPGYVSCTLILAAIACLCALEVTDVLKVGFGRAWPETWMNGNPSLIGDGVYGFFPFRGSDFTSFPSGQATAIAAPICVLWSRLPRWRPLYGAVVAVTAAGLLGADYHFVSDVIGGILVGSCVSAAILMLIGVLVEAVPADRGTEDIHLR